MSFTLMVHHNGDERIECDAYPENDGSLTISLSDNSDVTIFTGSAELSIALRDAIRNTLNTFYTARDQAVKHAAE